MTDRELLEMAAKAAGIEGQWGEEGYIGGREGFIPNGWLRDWNPLADDGDALRLAVKLGVSVFPPAFNGGFEATATAKAVDGPYIDESRHHDHNETTRRAIVRAAAYIGRGKQ